MSNRGEFRWPVLPILVMFAGLTTLVASGNQGIPPTSTTGIVSVSVGGGAITSNPYKCVNPDSPGTTVSLRPDPSGGPSATPPTAQSVPFPEYSATSGDGPACIGNVIFSGLVPGKWIADTDRPQVSCPVEVKANQTSGVKIYQGTCR